MPSTLPIYQNLLSLMSSHLISPSKSHKGWLKTANRQFTVHFIYFFIITCIINCICL